GTGHRAPGTGHRAPGTGHHYILLAGHLGCKNRSRQGNVKPLRHGHDDSVCTTPRSGADRLNGK
ncbi:MAG: hypothetical protein F4222_07085, partial [Gammaproteobacteria bacterium]|nr:hypothetical protein [Gammaproteobacteria bacterium]